MFVGGDLSLEAIMELEQDLPSLAALQELLMAFIERTSDIGPAHGL
jgi:hypothetical protein